MESIVSLTTLLQKALDDAKQEANSIIHVAQHTAEEMVTEAKTQAEKEVINAQLLLKQKEETKIKHEANQLLNKYHQKAASVRRLSEKRIAIALDLVLKEVLPQ